MGRFPIGCDRDGKRIYQYVYGKSYDETMRKMQLGQEIEKRMISGSRITLAEAYREWQAAVMHRVKASSLANYRLKFEKHILPALGSCMCLQITSDTVNLFIAQKLDAGLSPRYVRDIVTVLRTMLRYAEKRYRLQLQLDSIALPKCEHCETRAMDAAVQKRLTAYLSKHMDLTAFGILISLHMGLRIGELCGLRWEDVDLSRRCIRIDRTVQRISMPENGHKTKVVISSPKSAGSRRTIAIPDSLMPYFEQFRAEASCYLLTGTKKLIEPRTMQYRFKRILKHAEVQPQNFHKLRHTFATNCLEHGFDIKTLSLVLGHSSVSMTMSRYLHPDLQYERRLLNRVSAALACQSVSNRRLQ